MCLNAIIPYGTPKMMRVCRKPCISKLREPITRKGAEASFWVTKVYRAAQQPIQVNGLALCDTQNDMQITRSRYAMM